MTRAVLTSPALCDHVRPGRDSSHNTPSSVPTARSTARLAVSSLQHAPRRRKPSTTPSSRYSTWYKSASQYSSSERSRQLISHQLRRMTVRQVRKLRLTGISSDSSCPQEHRSGATCPIYDSLSSFSGVTSITTARSLIHWSSESGVSDITYFPVTFSICQASRQFAGSRFLSQKI
jgi:hypothetical protein